MTFFGKSYQTLANIPPKVEKRKQKNASIE